MTDEEKLTLIQKYEDLPEEEFKEECFEDLKKFAFDKDDTVKTFTASVLSRFVNTAKQQEAIEILLQLCREENEPVSYTHLKHTKKENEMAEKMSPCFLWQWQM